MFELLLMRHAKSDWHSHTSDIDRPLNGRGRQDAAGMGAYLNQKGLVPDSLVISPSLRTRETASLLCENMSLGEDRIHVDNDLYSSEVALISTSVFERGGQATIVSSASEH